MKNVIKFLILLLCFTQTNLALAKNVLLDQVYATVSKPCNSSSNGKIDISITEDIGKFDFIWQKVDKNTGDKKLIKSMKNVIYGYSHEDLKNIDAGYYLFTITNKVCGRLDLEIFVEDMEKIEIPDPTINTDCATKASISFNKKNIFGGKEPYTFKWSSGQNTSNIEIFSDGFYTLTVTDSKGCTNSRDFQIKIMELVITPDVVTDCDGTDINLGIDPLNYTIIWKINNHHEPLLDNLSIVHDEEGLKYSYAVETKNKQCKFDGVVDLGSNNAYRPIKIGDPTITASCSGAEGIIKFLSTEIKGGTGILSYKWSNGATTQNILNLMPGTYTITVSDEANCTASKSFDTSPNGGVWYEKVLITPSCSGSNAGQIVLFNPLPNVEIKWDNGKTGNVIDNLNPGEYCCDMKLENCSVRKCFTIEEIPLVPINIVETITPSCQGTEGTGRIDLSINGGTAPITIEWADQSTKDFRKDLKPGLYSVTVADVCQRIIKTFEVKQFSYPIINLSGNVVNGLEGGNTTVPTGSITLDVSGGSGSFSYFWQYLDEKNSWLFISSSKNLINIKSGKYKIDIYDKTTGCFVSKQYLLKNSECSTLPILINVKTITLDNHACDGPPVSIDITHFFGTLPNAPVEISVVGNSYSYKKILQTKAEVESQNLLTLSNLSRQTYVVRVKDACNRTGEKTVDLCPPCNGGLEYDISEKDHEIKFRGIDMKLVVQCACRNDNCAWWTYLKYLHPALWGVSLKRTLVKVEDCPPVGVKYTFTWPDGEKYSTKGKWGTTTFGKKQLECEETGRDHYVVPDEEIGTVIKVKVEREDGCVNLEIPIGIVTFDEEIVFHPIQNAVGEIFDPEFHGGTTIKENCTSKTKGPQYKETSEYEELPFYFVFTPNNPYATDPCLSGGTFTGCIFNSEGKAEVNMAIPIPPGVAKGGVISWVKGQAALGAGALTSNCERGGECYFDAKDIYGIKLNKLLLMPWCSSSIPVDPDPDPEDEDEDDEDEEEDEDDLENGCPDDEDCDGIEDDTDNCPNVKNKNQKNSDPDKFGDKCDNCDFHENPFQEDSDGDGIGNACDNCNLPNKDQADGDGDGIGDPCDLNTDSDFDGILDAVDNCKKDPNNNQLNSDMDLLGDLCDNCDFVDNPDQLDSDKDGVGDLCDNCPFIKNSNQSKYCECPQLSPPTDYPVKYSTDFWVDLPFKMLYKIKYTYPNGQVFVEDFKENAGQGIKIEYKKHKGGIEGIVKAELICNYPAGCLINEIQFRLEEIRFTNPGDPNDNVNCDDPIDISYNIKTNQFVYFRNIHSLVSYNIIGEEIDTLDNGIVREVIKIRDTTKIKFIKYDIDGNLVVFGTNGSNTKITIYTPDKIVLYSQEFTNILIENFPSEIVTYPLTFYGYNVIEQKFYKVNWSYRTSGYTLDRVDTRPCAATKQCTTPFFLENGEIVYIENEYNTTKLTFVGPSVSRTITFLGKIKITKIATLKNGEYIIAGSTKENIIINGNTYSISNVGKETPVVIWLDKFKEITTVKIMPWPFNNVIKHLTFNHQGTYIYTTIVKDTLLFENKETIIDSCGFINGFKINQLTDNREILNEIKEYENALNAFPNPFNSEITLEFISTNDDVINLIISNNQGQQIFKEVNLPILKGVSLYNINKSLDWPSGLYTISVIGSNFSKTQKIIKIE